MANPIDELTGEAESPRFFELVTLTPEQIKRGAVGGTPLRFADLKSALAHARSMPPSEQELSWIRTPEEFLTLAQAEDRVRNSNG